MAKPMTELKKGLVRAFAQPYDGPYINIKLIRADHKNARVMVRRHYFYTYGMTAKLWGQKVQQALEVVGLAGVCEVVETENHYRAWPQDNWFVAYVAYQTGVADVNFDASDQAL